ncbi:hypothetical protein Tco_1287469 [Tanacetum coccineum]
MQLLLRRPMLQIMVISNGLEIWSLTQCGVKCRSTMINMHSGEFLIGDTNVNNSMDLLPTRNLLVMYTTNVESLLSQNFRLSNSKAINIWIGSPFIEMMRSYIHSRKVTSRGVESYQKKLNITKPDTYRSDIKCRDAYTAYSNPRGFIYQNKDKNNKLMHIDELHKFSDGTLNDVWTALNDRLKGIRMEYLPQTIWRQSDRERAKVMIQAIDKQLKSRRIMRCLERFISGGDFRLL